MRSTKPGAMMHVLSAPTMQVSENSATWSASPLTSLAHRSPQHSHMHSSMSSSLLYAQAQTSKHQSSSLTHEDTLLSQSNSLSHLLPRWQNRLSSQTASPATPSTSASATNAKYCGGGLNMSHSVDHDDIAKLLSESSTLRVENSMLMERHWILCSEISGAADEMRKHMRRAAHASGDGRLSLEHATQIGSWFLQITDRLKNSTLFMHKPESHSFNVGTSAILRGQQQSGITCP